MKYRFRVLEINTTDVDGNICGQAPTVLDKTNLRLKIVVNNTTILDTADLSAHVFTPATIINCNGINVTGLNIENNDYIVFEVQLDNVWDSTNVGIIAESPSHLNYTNSHTIFGYDLGNNPNQVNTDANPITYNPDMDIVLPHVNVAVGNVLAMNVFYEMKAATKFVAYRRPFTNEIYYYRTIASGGISKYRKADNSGNEILNTEWDIQYLNEDDEVQEYQANGMIVSENFIQLKQRIRLYKAGVLSSDCTSALQAFAERAWTPDFNTEITNDSDCNDEVSNTVLQNTARTYIDYSLITTVFVNDDEVYPFEDQELKYTLIDIFGTELNNEDYAYQINPVPFVYNSDDYLFQNFVTPEVGDYIVRVELLIPGVYSKYKTYTVRSCHWFEVTQTDCNKYEVCNRGFDDFTLNVYKLTDTETFTLVDSMQVDKCSCTTVQHNENGIYKYEFKELTPGSVTGEPGFYIIHNYCNLRDCLLDYIKKILCGTITKCTDTKDHYDFVATVMAAWSYFNILNKQYTLNFMFDALSPNQLNELHEARKILERVSEYCEDCDTPCGCNDSSTSTKKGDCGCS